MPTTTITPTISSPNNDTVTMTDLCQATLQGTERSTKRGSDGQRSEHLVPGGDYSERSFTGQGLIGYDLTAACFDEAQFHQADLSNATFCHARMCRISGTRSIWCNADCASADLRGASILYGNCTMMNLRCANLSHASFTSANCTGIDLRGAILHRTSFVGANLTGAHFEGAILKECDFRRCTFDMVNLAGFEMRGCLIESQDVGAARHAHMDLTGVMIVDPGVYHKNGRR